VPPAGLLQQTWVMYIVDVWAGQTICHVFNLPCIQSIAPLATEQLPLMVLLLAWQCRLLMSSQAGPNAGRNGVQPKICLNVCQKLVTLSSRPRSAALAIRPDQCAFQPCHPGHHGAKDWTFFCSDEKLPTSRYWHLLLFVAVPICSSLR
jgi:hypothetical protein